MPLDPDDLIDRDRAEQHASDTGRKFVKRRAPFDLADAAVARDLDIQPAAAIAQGNVVKPDAVLAVALVTDDGRAGKVRANGALHGFGQ